ncbi:MAG: hypothetical protein C4567_08140 [Deltaproteobacteria bacterium]|nr:MAG: hypothetical protein C4567_08140 [Deltaproteobacteria bacterium]
MILNILKVDFMKFNLRQSKLWTIWPVLLIAALLSVASQAYAFRFVVMADSPDNETNKGGLNLACLEYLRGQILELNPRPDMVFFLGDLVTKAYQDLADPPDPAKRHYYIPDWKAAMAPLAQAGVKIYVSIGNRDLYPSKGWPPSKEMEQKFQEDFSDPPYFDMPDNGSPNYKKLAYSVAHENAFFVVLDTFGFKPDGANYDNGLDAEQLAWFSGQARGATQKFKFAFSHGPAFSPEGFAVGDSVKKTMWGIMEGAQFDAYFCGHEHIYSRWAITRATAPWITRRITQVLTGAGGALPDQIFKVKQDRRKVHAFSLYNYVVGDVNENDAQFQAVGVDWNAGNYTARIIDRFALQK